MKVSSSILIFALAVVTTRAEPPVHYSTTNEDTFSPPLAGAPSSSYGVPSSTYGPPSTGRFGGTRQTTAVLRPSSNYGAPPSSSYGVPSVGSHRGSSNFGTSRFGGRGDGGQTGYRGPSTSYGTSSTGFGVGSGQGYNYEEGSSGPANYQFSYHVQDAASGNDFGHQESREGHVAKGMYMVLLPDGRRQIVEYTADERGYHPIVRYEGTATGAGINTSGGGYRY